MRDGTAALTPLTQVSTYPGQPDQAGKVREFVSAVLDGSPVEPDAILCVSELAANAILHSRSGLQGGTFVVKTFIADGEHIRIEVSDQGGPWSPNPDQGGQGGRGLLIVSRLANDWGITGDGGSGRTIWFELNGRPCPPDVPSGTRRG